MNDQFSSLLRFRAIAVRVVSLVLMALALRWGWLFGFTSYRNHLRPIMLPLAFGAAVLAGLLWWFSSRTALRRRKGSVWITLSGSLVLTFLIADAADNWNRCYSAPLSRAEAIERAHTRFERFAQSYSLPSPLPTLVDAEFEADSNSWLVTFRGNDCEVIVITDRCRGDDIGGTTKCR